MGDDWDPFADPADEAPAPAAAAAISSGSSKEIAIGELWDAQASEDIFAWVHEPPRERKQYPIEEFVPLLDNLFGIPDSDTKALQDAFKPVVAAMRDDNGLSWLVWRRAVPILADFNKPDTAKRPNILGLLVDEQLGLYKTESHDMNDIFIHSPQDCPPSGVAVFLFGWGGGGISDMDDIHNLYSELFPGAVIARLTCNMKGSLGLRKECAYAIHATITAWGKLPANCPKQLIVHLFSNGGFMTWTEMLQLWDELSNREEPHSLLVHPVPPMKEVLRGLILDSACDTDIKMEACVTSLVQSMAGFIGMVVSTDHDGSEAGRKAAELNGKKAIQLLIGTTSPVRAHLMKKPEKFITRQSCVDGKIVHDLEPPVSMQFIYSKDDNVILHAAVEAYIEQVNLRPNRSSFAPPRKLFFEKSKHCFHKVLHKEEYWSCLKLFVKNTVHVG